MNKNEKKNDSFEKHGIGYENNGKMYEINQNEKVKSEKIYFVQHDL